MHYLDLAGVQARSLRDFGEVVGVGTFRGTRLKALSVELLRGPGAGGRCLICSPAIHICLQAALMPCWPESQSCMLHTAACRYERPGTGLATLLQGCTYMPLPARLPCLLPPAAARRMPARTPPIS